MVDLQRINVNIRDATVQIIHDKICYFGGLTLLVNISKLTVVDKII